MTQSFNQHDLYSDHGGGDDPLSIEGLASRHVALDLLMHVLGQKQALDIALEQNKNFLALPARDKAFCRMLTSTTLRRLGQIDDLIARAEDKPGSRSSSGSQTLVLQNILRLGVCQILFMDVADHAAVDTSVRLVDAAEMDRMKGFVNGVLRTMTRTGKVWLEKQDEVRLNTPEWLLKTWIEDYGLKTAALIAKANLTEAPFDITIKDEKDRNYWTSSLKATSVGNGSLRSTQGGAVQDIPGFDDGMWWVQDASAAIPAGLFGDITGKSVVDMCAAPGGKTMQLASKGAHVIALDRSAQRMKRMKENLHRVRLEDHVQEVIADGSVWRPKEAPSMILLDAPCTATGTIRRHPDLAHLKSPRDLESLVRVQEQLLENAFNVLSPGGTLIYCTCSLQKAEGEDQIVKLFANHPDAMKRPIEAKEVGDWDEALTEEGDLRIFPYHHNTIGGMDGFFISRIMKVVG